MTQRCSAHRFPTIYGIFASNANLLNIHQKRKYPCDNKTEEQLVQAETILSGLSCDELSLYVEGHCDDGAFTQETNLRYPQCAFVMPMVFEYFGIDTGSA